MIAENKNSPNVFNKVDGRQDFAKNDGQQLDFTKIDDKKITSLNDRELFSLCQKYGEQTRIWRQKFAGLLPEVLKRRLYERKGFESIFVFAKKLAGMSEEQVRRVLNLEQKFEDKPILKNLLLNGEVSANKLARIASIATPANQEFLAEKVQILSKSALETFVKDERIAKENFQEIEDQNNGNLFSNTSTEFNEIENKNGSAENQKGYLEPPFNLKSVPGHTQTTDLFNDVKLLQKLSPELKTKLKELDEKGLDINQILLELLQNRDEEIAMEKEQIGEEIVKAQLMQQQKQAASAQEKIGVEIASAQEKSKSELPTKKPSHYINVKIKNLLKKEHGDKCSISGCNKPATTIHHTQRFGLSHNNDPRFLAPFCEQHHEIAHSIDQKYQQKRVLAISA